MVGNNRVDKSIVSIVVYAITHVDVSMISPNDTVQNEVYGNLFLLETCDFHCFVCHFALNIALCS